MERNDVPGTGAAGQLRAHANECAEKMAVELEPTLRDRLERKRNRLTRQLAQCEAALQVLYTVPDAERIAAILKQAD